LRIGGRVRFYTRPTTTAELIEAVRWALDRSLPVLTIGAGSNLLLDDRGWPGLVIHTDKSLVDYSIQGNVLRAQAGCRLQKMVKNAVDQALGGIEELAGIPASFGGAVVMNAGAGAQQISDTLQTVTAVDLRTACIVEFAASECQFRYRGSIFLTQPYLVISATLRLAPSQHEPLLEQYRQKLKWRKQHQPLSEPNCGSVFKNPAGNFAAAQLIDSCGLKGYCIGGVCVSRKHANFFIPSPGAATRDFLALIQHVQNVVYSEKGVMLEPEVRYLNYKE